MMKTVTNNRINPPSDDLKSHFTMLPNVVFEMGLDPLAFRLYAHIVFIGVQCWASTRHLAAACKMSVGAIVKAKRVLVERGLITVTAQKDDKQQVYHDIRLTDIWELNRTHHAEKRAKVQGGGVHVVNGGCSCGEQGCSPGERNKTHMNKKESISGGNFLPPGTGAASTAPAQAADAAREIDSQNLKFAQNMERKRQAVELEEAKLEELVVLSPAECTSPAPQNSAPPAAKRKARPADAVIEAVRQGSFAGAPVTPRIAGIAHYLIKAVHGGEAVSAEQCTALAEELKLFYTWYAVATNHLHPPTTGDKLWCWLQRYRHTLKPVQPREKCKTCEGKGWVWVNLRAGETRDCPDCAGGMHDVQR